MSANGQGGGRSRIARVRPVVLRGLAGVLGAVLVCVLAGGFWLSETRSGREWLRQTLEQAVDDPAGLRLRIGAVEGSLLSDLVVRDVTLEDPHGVWLSLGRARLSWTPLALLLGRLSVDALEADTLHVTRLPELPGAPPDPKEDSGTGIGVSPSILGRVSIRSLKVGPVFLGAPVLGHDLSLSLEGQTEGQGRSLRTSVRLEAGPDGAGAGLRADITSLFQADPANLDLTVSLSEPAGGVLGGLAGFPDHAGFSFQMSGHGPLSGWDATIGFRIEDVLDVGGTLALALGDREQTGALSLSAAPLTRAPAVFGALLGTSARLDVEAARGQGNVVRLSKLTVASASLDLEAGGQVDLSGSAPTFDLETRAALKGPSLVSLFLDDFGLTQADLTARLSGTVAKATADVHLSATDAVLGDIIGAHHLDLKATLRPRTGLLALGKAAVDLSLEADADGFALPVAGSLVEAALGGTPRLRAAGGLEVAPDLSRLVWHGVSLALNGKDVSLEGQGDFDILDLRLAPFRATLEVPQVGTLAPGLDGPARLEARTDGFTAWPLSGDLALEARGDLARGSPDNGETGAASENAAEGPAPSRGTEAAGGAGAPDTLKTAQAPGTPAVSPDAPQGQKAQTATAPLDPPLWRLFGASPTGRLRVVFSTEPGHDTLRIEDLELNGAGARAAGHMALGGDAGRLEAVLQASVDDPGSFGVGFRGDPVTLDLTATGPLSDPALDLAVNANRLEGPGLTLEGLSISGRVQRHEGGPSGLLEAGGTIDGRPLQVHIPFEVTQEFGRLAVSEGVLRYANAVARLGADVDLGSLPASKATLRAEVPDLSVLSAFGAPADLRGHVSLNAALVPARGKTAAALDASLSGGGLALGDLKPGDLGGRATLRDPFGAARLDATLSLGAGQAGIARWSRVALSATGPLDALKTGLEIDGALAAGATGELPLSVRVGAGLTPGGEDRRIVVSPVRVQVGPHRLEQTSNATLHLLPGGGLRLENLNLALDTGRIEGSGSFGAGAGAGAAKPLTVRLSAIPLTLVETFAPGLGIGGRLEGTASVSGTADHPVVRVALVVPELRSTASASRALGARLEGTLDRALDARLTLEGSARPLVATVRVGGGGDGATLSGASRLTARIQGGVELADLLAFTPLIEHRASGVLDLDVQAGGTLGAPSIQGTASLRKARYENLLTGTLLTDVDLDVGTDRARNVSVSLRAGDGDSGTVRVDGTLALADLARPRGSVDLLARNAALVRRDDVEAGANADIHVELHRGGGAVTGTVTTTRVLVRLMNTLGGSIPDLPVVEKGAGTPPANASASGAGRVQKTGTGATRKAGAEVPAEAVAQETPLTLDVHVVLPGHVKVTGQGIDTEWKGDLKVGGTASAPSIVGSIANVRGQIELVGRVFSLKNSVVRFDGGKTIDPALDIRASNKAGKIDATVRVTGTATSPSIAFEADPPLPQDEVVAHVLFGKSSGELSAMEAIQLARALAQLKDFGSGGTDIMGRIRDAFGLDVLRFGESADGSSTLEAGAYLRENVYVGVVQGMEPGESAVHVEVELTPEISVESQVGASGTGAAGLLWKWDY
ncbi:translocation/assembly module TamB domain-containing protein [Phaeovibrio sulfidiphilus]|uniref:Translocation/assembly module TamB domain-containing protein n=1 Tax=Phaeovibrio sulfidiphilus TaxID=1220600 RepID=A0A8J6YPM7_9PROT|nr:translocation/assembly module TamB domain-containing protein [Phaeovibrio sulfidiphilus]MBE1236937.1 translocation/assembly module TamB domain-containing protein [Phaeovibrio sulfidiphilus]